VNLIGTAGGGDDDPQKTDGSAAGIDPAVPFARTHPFAGPAHDAPVTNARGPVFWLRTIRLSLPTPAHRFDGGAEQWHERAGPQMSITAARPRRIFTAFPK
jgi:hypothetical protein